MMKYLLFLLFFFTGVEASTSIKKMITQNLNDIENISFKFEQNINGKIENGNCSIKYPFSILPFIFCSNLKEIFSIFTL